MKARLIAQQFNWIKVGGDLEREIGGCSSDSRSLEAGDIFICFPGTRFDGHDYVQKALQRGAAAFVCERPVDLPPGTPFFLTENTRSIAGPLASFIYDHPSCKMQVLGVTGTSGKTTTTYFLRQILMEAGKTVELVGSLNPTPEFPFHTTPEAPALQKRLFQLQQRGVEYAIIEVSSHAVQFKRIAGVHFSGAILTNLYRDHLDLHGTEEAYARTKLSFLLSLEGTGPVAINRDFPRSPLFLEACSSFAHSFSLSGEADVRGLILSHVPGRQEMEVSFPTEQIRCSIQLPGTVNLSNALAAMTLLYFLDFEPHLLARGASRLEGVAGRYQIVDTVRGGKIVVDFAHTPVALRKILQDARKWGKKVILLFGCVGAGDRGKRREMGEIAAAGADLIFISTDDPRGEDPAQIAEEIEAGLVATGKRKGEDYIIELERKIAIEKAIEALGADEILVIAGRGHECYQRFGERLVYLDDLEEVRRLTECLT